MTGLEPQRKGLHRIALWPALTDGHVSLRREPLSEFHLRTPRAGYSPLRGAVDLRTMLLWFGPHQI